MITSLIVGDKISLKTELTIFEIIGTPSELYPNEEYTVDQIEYSCVDGYIVRVGLKEKPYSLYYIGLFEKSLKLERREKLNKLNKI